MFGTDKMVDDMRPRCVATTITEPLVADIAHNSRGRIMDSTVPARPLWQFLLPWPWIKHFNQSFQSWHSNWSYSMLFLGPMKKICIQRSKMVIWIEKRVKQMQVHNLPWYKMHFLLPPLQIEGLQEPLLPSLLLFPLHLHSLWPETRDTVYTTTLYW